MEKIEDNQQAQTKILEEFQNIQLDTEKMLLQAIEDREQAIVDKLKEEADALRDASDKYTEGLSEALNKERELYNQNENEQTLSRLQRQLAILQRSGGSASAIKSLQDQIESQMQDQYFTERENEINVIKEASDKQLEKMQTQIDLMTEALEYQKENGLWWPEVYDKMNNWDANSMAAFVAEWTKEFKSLSALDVQKKMSDNLKTIEKWVEYNATKSGFDNFVKTIKESDYGINDKNRAEMIAGGRVAYATALEETHDEAAAQQAAKDWWLRKKEEAQAPGAKKNGNGSATGGNGGSGNKNVYW